MTANVFEEHGFIQLLIGSIVDRVTTQIKTDLTAQLEQATRVQPALLNIKDAAIYLGRTVKGVRDLERKGVLPAVRLDRKLQFRRRDLDDLIERCAA